jgi:hypothetical protein
MPGVGQASAGPAQAGGMTQPLEPADIDEIGRFMSWVDWSACGAGGFVSGRGSGVVGWGSVAMMGSFGKLPRKARRRSSSSTARR